MKFHTIFFILFAIFSLCLLSSAIHMRKNHKHSKTLSFGRSRVPNNLSHLAKIFRKDTQTNTTNIEALTGSNNTEITSNSGTVDTTTNVSVTSDNSTVGSSDNTTNPAAVASDTIVAVDNTTTTASASGENTTETTINPTANVSNTSNSVAADNTTASTDNSSVTTADKANTTTDNSSVTASTNVTANSSVIASGDNSTNNATIASNTSNVIASNNSTNNSNASVDNATNADNSNTLIKNSSSTTNNFSVNNSTNTHNSNAISTENTTSNTNNTNSSSNSSNITASNYDNLSVISDDSIIVETFPVDIPIDSTSIDNSSDIVIGSYYGDDDATNFGNCNETTNNNESTENKRKKFRNSNRTHLKGPNGEKMERVEIVQKLSPYAQVDYHERDKPEYKNNFLIGKPIYLENNITFDETPNIFDKVVTESLTGVITPVLPERKLWKNFNNRAFKTVPYNERTGPLELTENPVIKSRPVKLEIRKITESPKSIDSHIFDVPNPVKSQVYANNYDSVISLDDLPKGNLQNANQKRISHFLKKNLRRSDEEVL